MKYNFEINIVHYKELKERKQKLENELEKHNIKYSFIDNFDRKSLTKEELSKFTDDINNAYKANFLTHIKCFQNLLLSNNEYILIMEDDSLPKKNFYKKINKYLDELPKDFDLFYVSEGKSNFRIPINKRRPFQNIYKKENTQTIWGGHGATKFADGYFISRKCAQNLVNEFNIEDYKIDTSIDWWKNEMIEKHKLTVFWAEPPLISTNLYDTSFSGNYGQGKK